MKIFVNNSKSIPLCTFEVDSNVTVECLKSKIQERLEIPPEQQQLSFTDKILDVEKTLDEYEICNESSIMLEIKTSIADKAITCEEGLNITEKGTLKWHGEFEGLTHLIEKLQLTKGRWSSPGGGSKLYESEEFSIRWYSTNGTITFKGNKASEIKTKFISNIDNTAEEFSQSQDDCQITSDLHKDSIKTNGPFTNYPTCDPTCGNLEQYLLINDLMSKFMKTIDDKVDGISQEVNNLKSSKSQPDQTDMINNFKREIDELKKENIDLRQRNATISYVMADLQTKVKDTENEKNSLITAIKLIQLDQTQPSRIENQIDTWHTVNNKKSKVGKTSKNPHKTTASNANVNRYEVLSDSDVEPTEERSLPHVEPTTSQNNSGNKESSSGRLGKTFTTNTRAQPRPNQDCYLKSKTTEGPIAILGDSMIKMIKSPKLSRSTGEKVNIKTFPGATINDMNHYVQPTMKKQPKLVILHVGTNDVQRKEPEEITDEMKSLCQGIVSQSLSKIAISEIIKRQDPIINIKIDKTNTLLAKLCSKFKWQFIRHANIDVTKLNASGLHLNSQGTALLAKNLIEFLKN